MTSEPEAQERAVALPTGTVTFLFTDIEGSTQRWETHRQVMDAAVKRHDVLMRSAMEAHGGHVFKTVGDAFCVAFARVSDAVAACVDAQRALSAEDFSAVEGLRVRSALHTGEAVERNGDYFGPAVNRVARLMSIGHGGQVLLSGVTRDLVHGDLPTGVSLVDLGSHRLKDLAEPEHVWQLVTSGLPGEFPELQSLETLPNNLPIQLTSLRGREHDLEEARMLLGKHRLLTLFGAGGVGKTRLALQTGADLLGHYADGVWFADLAPISDPKLVASVVANVLGIGQPEGHSVDESITAWLRRKRLLLILDSCEHLLDAAAKLAESILKAAPDVRILSTSRQALGIAGEIVLRLPSLDLPKTTAVVCAEDAMRYGAIALFVDRAAASDTHFTLTDENAPVVADICRRLDGIPLAIELAAARVKVLSLANLAQRLDERFKILTAGSRTALPRQKTLSALIDWSYELLSNQERKLFNRVGVFSGGFSLDAATRVCSGDELNQDTILDLVTSLVDKSLVVAETDGSRERFDLLESTRAYALEKLIASGEGERLAREHAAYFYELAQAADSSYRTTTTTSYLAGTEPDIDNFRAVLDWSLTRGKDVTLGASLAGTLRWLWYFGGLHAEGRWWMRQAQSAIGETAQPAVAAEVWLGIALLTSGKRQHEAAVLARQFYESAGDAGGSAWAQWLSAYALKQMGHRDEAASEISEALAKMRQEGDKQGVAACLTLQAGILWPLGDTARARGVYAQAIAAFRALGDDQGVAAPLNNLAELEFVDGNVPLALRYATEVAQLDLRTKNPVNVAICQNDIAAYRVALGDLEGARQVALIALDAARRAQHPVQIAVAAMHLALTAAPHHDLATAGRLIGYLNATYQDMGLEIEAAEKASYQHLTAMLRESLSGAEIERLTAEGAAWSEDQAVEEALKV